MAVATLNELGQEIFETRYAYPGETSWAEEQSYCKADGVC